jgi:glycosyltransferase involved in cell wall biosynthesis
LIENKIKILFISHTYPPVIGGVESQNYELYTWLSKIADVELIANKKRWLIPFFLAYVAFVALFRAKKYDAILLGSCILGNVGWMIKKFSKTPVIAVAHGLDLTWNNPVYKLWTKIFIPSVDKIIAVGNETIRVAKEKGIPEDKIVFIPNGVDPQKYYKSHSREELEKLLGEKINGRKIILSTGRLASHKGIDWFTENVVPKLSDNTLFIIAGNGEKKKEIEKIIKEKKIIGKVKLLGHVNTNDFSVLYNTCDIYVKPNIKVKGTMEGFGLVAIEAASCKLPVIASNLEGLKDAIKDGWNGFMIEPYDTDGFVKKINELLENSQYCQEFGEKARQFVIDNFSWNIIAEKYLEEIKETINNT